VVLFWLSEPVVMGQGYRLRLQMNAQRPLARFLKNALSRVPGDAGEKDNGTEEWGEVIG
jgi:hypothetical protein